MLDILQINLHQCEAACYVLSRLLQKILVFICVT